MQSSEGILNPLADLIAPHFSACSKPEPGFSTHVSWCLFLYSMIWWFGLGLWCLTPLSTLFQVYRWGLVLLVEETRVPVENHRPAVSQGFRLTDKLYHIILYQVHPAWAEFELTKLEVICTDCDHHGYFSDLRWEVICSFIEIVGVDHHCLNFLFIMLFVKCIL